MNSTSQLYSDIELTTEVMTASNHRLIQMLFDKCLQHIYLSRNHILAQDYQSKRYNISKAADIVNYLRTCLNFEDKQAADLVTLLDSLYVFLEKSLLQATLKNETQYLDQAEKVLSIVKSGWDGIASK